MLKIQIDTIKDEELILEGAVKPSDLPELSDLLAADQSCLKETIRYRFRIFRVSGMIELQGHIAAEADLACGRCLEGFSLPIESDFELTFADELPEVEDESGEEIELSAEDMGISLLEGEELDLSEFLIEQLMLNMPFRPICRKDCKGLCPHCGADLNKEACQCHEEQFDTRFAALKNLKIESDK